MQVEVAIITPKDAAAMLERNTRNRPMRPRAVNRYARAMAEGLWQVTGDAIRFDGDGVLLDGQHRLAAIAQSGASVPTLVIRGIDSSAQAVMDSGGVRKDADRLQLLSGREVKNANSLAAAIKFVIAYERDEFDQLNVKQHSPYSRGWSQLVGTELLDAAARHEGLHYWVAYVSSRRTARRLLKSGALSAFAYLASLAYEADEVEEFINRIESGADLKAGDPELALRNRMVNLIAAGAITTGISAFASTIGAWNDCRRSTARKVYKAPKSVPRIDGLPPSMVANA
jgi:hypothetical protein